MTNNRHELLLCFTSASCLALSVIEVPSCLLPTVVRSRKGTLSDISMESYELKFRLGSCRDIITAGGWGTKSYSWVTYSPFSLIFGYVLESTRIHSRSNLSLQAKTGGFAPLYILWRESL